MPDGESRARAVLARLAGRAPQVLLLEGGSEEGRLNMALLWAMFANCPQALEGREDGCAPCGECLVCRQIKNNEYMDLHIYDGRISNRQDEDNPGPVRALSMENMHVLKRLNATAPHGGGRRVAIFQGMGQTREEALNSLLKTLEEPTEHTLFVLLAAQRQQLLPTLVSRSFCITLPWSGCRAGNEALAEWEDALGVFLARGTGFLDKIAARGVVDGCLAGQIVVACQKSLGRVLSGFARRDSQLDRALAPLRENTGAAMLLGVWVGEAQEMLAVAVAPARVLEGFCSRLYSLLRRKP